MVYYLDSSGAAKFVVEEAESAALDAWVESQQVSFTTSLLTRVELLRFASRYGASAIAEVDDFWSLLDVTPFSEQVAEHAGQLNPVTLRSLDAIHLATALNLGDGIAGVVTYDHRLAEACLVHGLEVVAPA